MRLAVNQSEARTMEANKNGELNFNSNSPHGAYASNKQERRTKLSPDPTQGLRPEHKRILTIYQAIVKKRF